MSVNPVLFLIIFLHFLSSQHTLATNSSSDIPNTVLYKDVEINPQFNISARIFLPENATQTCRKLPLLIYYHGGAFVTESPFSQTYHTHVSSIVAAANIVAVSVDFRLAPQYPLPIAYQDSFLALKWVLSHCNGTHDLDHQEEWLQNYVDFEHVYLGGDSSGANIAHNMAIRVGSGELGQGITLHGMFLNCPYFWGNTPLPGNETSHPQWDAQAKKLWVAAYPNSTRGFDDPLLNPAMDPNLSKLGCRQVLVYVAGKDIFRDRGYYYAESLKESKWDGIVRVLEVKGEIHLFNLLFPNKAKAKEMIQQLALFLNDQFELIVTI